MTPCALLSFLNLSAHLQAAELVIKESVEPLLEEYRPPGITSLKFSKLSLGSVAPKIEGMVQIFSVPIASILLVAVTFSNPVWYIIFLENMTRASLLCQHD